MGNYWNTADTEHEWDGSYPSNVGDVRENAPGIGHVAAFPVKLPQFFVKAFSDEGDLWVDPFAGSGSTLVACMEENRRFLGIEKEPKYVAMALERVSKIAEEEVEYLMSRGLSRDTATAMIVRGFLHVDIEGLPPELAEEMKRAVEVSEKELF